MAKPNVKTHLNRHSTPVLETELEFLSYVFRQENYFPESGVHNER